MHDTLVSIIVPVYNAKAYLAECLDHLLSQSYRNIEVLLINDGSTDGSEIICRDYASRDARIKFYSVSNGGVSRARNIGLKHASGEFITFCDADDYLRDEAIAKCVACATRDGLDILQFCLSRCLTPTFLGGGCRLFHSVRTYLDSNLYNVCIGGSFIRRSVVGSILFDADMKYAEDQLFLFRVMVRSACLGKLQDDLYYYRYNPGSATNNYRTSDLLLSSRSLLDWLDDNPDFIDPVSHTINSLLFYAAASKDSHVSDFLGYVRNPHLVVCTTGPRSVRLFSRLLRYNAHFSLAFARVWVFLLRLIGHK